MTKPHASPIESAVAARGRKYHRFEVNSVLGIADKPLLEVDILSPVKDEEDGAVVAAHAHAKARAGEDKDAAADSDILTDGKIAEVLFRTCFEAQPADAAPGAIRYPAFPGGPKWMRANLTSDELAVMFNYLQGAKRADSPLLSTIDYESVENLARKVFAHQDSDVPDRALAYCTRDYLVQSFILLAVLYGRAQGWGAEATEAQEQDESAPQAEQQAATGIVAEADAKAVATT
jgi:hypothetical protein